MSKKRLPEQTWQNRIVSHGEQPANQFLAHELNARRHPGKQREALRGSLNAVGWVAPVIVSAQTGKILDGHARVEEALSQDENSLVPFVEVNVSEQEERTILATFDPITGLATYEQEGLDALLREVETGEVALQQMLSELAEKEGLYLDAAGVEPSDAEPQIDRAAELNKKWQVKTGDLWLIGNHRLLCGDSTEQEDVLFLTDNLRADLLLTDPPYNVNYEGGTGLTILNDHMSNDQFRQFLRASFKCAFDVCKPGAAFYIWHADLEGYNFRGAVNDCGQKVRQCLIWVKNALVMGRQDYHWQHEPCLYGWKEGASHGWYADRKQTTILKFDKPSQNTEHPTMKPVSLFAYLIANSTAPQGLCYDPFLGSGTTIVAAEQLGRRCFGLELSPDYCAVILERMATAFPALEIKRNAK